MSNLSTQIFYIVVMLIGIFFAFYSQTTYDVNLNDYCKIKKIPYCLSFMIPCFVIAFTNIGSDYENYYKIINRLTWDNYASFYSEEPGVNIFFLIIRTIANNNVDISIFLVKVLTMALFYISFYISHNEVKVGYSIAAYLLILYLPSFYLLTIALAAAIISVGMALFFFKKKRIIPLLLILLAAQLHNSAYIFLPVYLVCILIQGREMTKIKKIILAISYIVVTLSASAIYSYFQGNVSGFHYNNYGTNSFTGSGIMIIVIYAPLIVLMYYILRMDNIGEEIKNYIFVFTLSDCLFYVLSYQFQVIERMSYYTAVLYTLLFPFVLRKIEDEKTEKKFLSFTILELCMILYVLFRGYLVFTQRTTVSSGVGFYQFFNPFGK